MTGARCPACGSPLGDDRIELTRLTDDDEVRAFVHERCVTGYLRQQRRADGQVQLYPDADEPPSAPAPQERD